MSTKHHCDLCDKEISWIHEFEYSSKSPTVGASMNDGATLELCDYCMSGITFFLRRIKMEDKSK